MSMGGLSGVNAIGVMCIVNQSLDYVIRRLLWTSRSLLVIHCQLHNSSDRERGVVVEIEGCFGVNMPFHVVRNIDVIC